jgi:hypothetical protein
MSAEWPTSWQGQTHLDCGADGQLFTTIGTSSQPNGIHQQNFQNISKRWFTIWPEFRQCITELMANYKQPEPNWSDVRVVHLELPDEPLAEDAQWSIGVVFSATETMWVLPYRGLAALPDEALAIW